MRAAPNEWEIGMSSWIIQDGNYGDFETGQICEFALELYSDNFQSVAIKQKTFKKIGAARYEVIGKVIYLASEVFVLDFGVRTYQESKPPEGITIGSFVAAEIYLGIDSFSYFERLYKLQGMPPLIYTWKISSIAQQTAPFIESRDSSGRKVLMRDERKLAYKIITKTDAWNDDDGMAEYIFTYTPADAPATQTL